jgi:thiamine biosynthesis lipoprotein
MSFHDADSDVSHLNHAASTRAVRVDPWTFQVLETAIDLNRRSAGMFDITIAPVLQNMGLLPRQRDDEPSIPMKMRAIELRPDGHVRFLHPQVGIDLGGIAKGFAVDRAINVLRDHGMSQGLVNAGGDMAGFGPEPHSVYIRDPRSPGRALSCVALNNEALASSGGCFDPFQSSDVTASAIIDPDTQEPVYAIHGATVRAQSCLFADALTKIVMIGGESSISLLKQYGASALLVSADSGVQVTPNWQDAAHLAA